MKYLHRRRLGWYVAIEVPPSLRRIVKRRRIVRSLQTRDLKEAQRRRWEVVRAIKSELDAASLGYAPPSLVTEAIELRSHIAQAKAADTEGDGAAVDELTSALAARAEQIERERGPEVAHQFYSVASGRRQPLEHFTTRWIEEIRGEVKEHTRRQHQTAVKLLLGYVGEAAAVQAVTREQAGKFITEVLVASGRARKTCNRIISSLSSCWRWLRKRVDDKIENVWREQSLKKDKKRTKRAYMEPELVALLTGKPGGAVGATALPDLIRLGLFTGARLDEICSLQWRDVTLKREKSAIRIRDGKTDAAVREIPLHAEVRHIIERRTKGKAAKDFIFPELKPGGPDGKRAWYISRAFTAYRRSLKIPDKETDFHSLRRTFATAVEQAGVSPNVAAEIMGHKKQGMAFGLYSGGAGAPLVRAAIKRIRFGAAVMRAV